MKVYNNVESNSMPLEIDEISSSTVTYVNSDVEEVEINDGEGEEVRTVYRYTSTSYTKAEWDKIKLDNLNNKFNPTIDKTTCTLEEAIVFQHTKLAGECAALIKAGIDVTTSVGVEHFSLQAEDQLNIKMLTDNIVLLGLTSIAYHANGNLCRLFNAEEFSKVSFSAQKLILEQTTYCNHLLAHLSTLTDKEEVFAITYGDALPEVLNSQYADIVNNQLTAIITKINTILGITLTF